VDSLNHGTDCCYYFAFIKNLWTQMGIHPLIDMKE
jgi:hypothetical protein